MRLTYSYCFSNSIVIDCILKLSTAPCNPIEGILTSETILPLAAIIFVVNVNNVNCCRNPYVANKINNMYVVLCMGEYVLEAYFYYYFIFYINIHEIYIIITVYTVYFTLCVHYTFLEHRLIPHFMFKVSCVLL